MTASELLRKLVASGVDYYHGIHDNPSCFHCGEEFTDAKARTPHKPDCPWLAAKKFVELEDAKAHAPRIQPR